MLHQEKIRKQKITSMEQAKYTTAWAVHTNATSQNQSK